MGTAASSVKGSNYQPSNLIDGGGLDGSWADFQNGFCVHTRDGGGMEWFSLEMESPKKVIRVQIANRVDGCCWDRGRNIRISIGPSEAYDPNEPLCLSQIGELSSQPGLQDYECTGDLHEGKFVKISRAGILNLCEVKVFYVSLFLNKDGSSQEACTSGGQACICKITSSSGVDVCGKLYVLVTFSELDRFTSAIVFSLFIENDY